MLELFSYNFFVIALVVGSVTAVVSALIGNFVVAAKQSIMSDMLAHTALAGVGLGIFMHISPSLSAFFVSLIASILLWFLMRRRQQSPDAMAMLMLSGGLALALFFSHIAKNSTVSFDVFLFGSLLTVTYNEMLWFIGVNVIVAFTLLVLWRYLIIIVFDPMFAYTQTRKAHWIELLFMLMIGAMVAISLKVIGGLLIGALFVIPAIAAHCLVQSFRSSVLVSVMYGVIGVWCGLFASFYFDMPTSSGIVFALLLLYAISFGVSKMRSITRHDA